MNRTLTGRAAAGGTLSFEVVTNPANGALSGTAPNLTFTPNTGWFGTTAFSFKVNEGTTDSAPATVTIVMSPPPPIPAAPTNLTATATSSSQIHLTWSDNSTNELGFKIEQSTDGTSFTQRVVIGPDNPQIFINGLAANKTYYFRVRAYNAGGDSPNSNIASARTPH